MEMYNIPMDYKKAIVEQRDNYSHLVNSMSKQEFSFLAGKDTFRGKCFGFLTKQYYQRTRLLREGQLVYGYAFKAWTNDMDPSRTFPSWVLFSPEEIFSYDPDVYIQIANNIQKLCDGEAKEDNKNKELKKFKSALIEELSDPNYVKVPTQFSEGHLVYMSTIYVRPNQLPIFRLGLSVIIMNPNISKEVLYLPQKYMTKETSKMLFDI